MKINNDNNTFERMRLRTILQIIMKLHVIIIINGIMQ